MIYVITGAGGANLYNPEQQDDPASWQPFTHKFLSQVNSLDHRGRRRPDAHRPPGLRRRARSSIGSW